jgi:hypothetical protein
MFGRFRSSSRTGLTICLTDIRLISWEVRNEKDTPATVEGNECAIFMINAQASSLVRVESRKFFAWNECHVRQGWPTLETGHRAQFVTRTKVLSVTTSLKSLISSLNIDTGFLGFFSGLIKTLTNVNINLFCATTESDEPRILKGGFHPIKMCDVCKCFSRSNPILCIRLSKNLQAYTSKRHQQNNNNLGGFVIFAKLCNVLLHLPML